MTSHRRGPSEHVLIAGDEGDLPAIMHLVWLLPEDAYGQIFIETLTVGDREPLPVPERVGVTWLDRSSRASHTPSLVFAERGEVLAQAVAGWAGEWLNGGDSQLAERHLLWIGSGGSLHMAAVSELLLFPFCPHVNTLGPTARADGRRPAA